MERLKPPYLGALLPAAVLGLVVLAYAPSLSGGWVWDDHEQIAGSGALARPLEWLVHDVWWLSAGDTPSTLYRPLAVITHVPGQALVGGPFVERLINLALHLVAVFLVARIALHLGAGPRAAWLGAALLGVHPGASEVVAWISARHDLLATVFLLGGWLALVGDPAASVSGAPDETASVDARRRRVRRDVLAGLLLGLAPFCKEPFLLAPLSAIVWMLALRRLALPTLVISGAGGVLYLAIRMAIDLPFPVSAARFDSPLAALGAVAGRGLELALIPGSSDAAPLFAPAPVLGALVLAVGAGGLAYVVGRPALGALLASVVLLVPALPASAESGVIGDRFFYVAFAGLAIAAGVTAAQLPLRRPGFEALLALLIPVLAFGTWLRAGDWTDDHAVFAASLLRNPSNPHAAFRLGHDLHARKGSCERALPYYTLARQVEARAGNNLQACLLDLGRVDEAIALGPELARRDPIRATPLVNTSRALLERGRLVEAEGWARRALARNPRAAGSWVLLGASLGRQGRHRAASEAFERALAFDPDDADARGGLAVANARLRADGSGES